ncbi:MAG: efflux RND transporter periplasmic adaptor subunit, partial [Planctomycetaceae bacterium]|nr:efflux RND transporter periplasmic adaptor subunit [Planctomycetaceae bacterium]
NKYLEGELPQERDKILGQIRLKEEQLARKQESYEFTKRLAKKGYRSQSDLEAERIAMTQAEIELRVERENLRVLENFTSKRMIRELEADATELVREQDRVKRQTNAAMSKAEAEYESSRLTLAVEKQRYEDWLKQIELCVMRAPQDGQIVYANSNASRRGSSTEAEIYQGATVRERQAIVKIPDMTRMKIDAKIHESKISQLALGQEVIIRADAQPGEEFHGEVSAISSVPLSGSFPNYDIKEYQVAINLTDPPERVSLLRPGLSAEFEVIVEDRTDVLQIPLQSIVQIGRDYYAWVVTDKKMDRRKVKVGKSNDTDIEVLDGVSQGEQVAMSPRTLFSEEIKTLEEKMAAQMGAEGKGGKPGGFKPPGAPVQPPGGQSPNRGGPPQDGGNPQQKGGKRPEGGEARGNRPGPGGGPPNRPPRGE